MRLTEDMSFPRRHSGIAMELTPLHSDAMQPFHEMLAQLMERPAFKEMSKRRFAALVRVSHTTVNEILRGKYTPSLEFLERSARLFGLTGETRDRYMAAGKTALAAGKADTSAHVLRMQDRLNELEGSLRIMLGIFEAVAEMAAKSGVKLPRDFFRAVADIKQRLNPRD